ncbi:MAG: hypothetical protein AAF940_09725 [Pseudomonadota bacterium]
MTKRIAKLFGAENPTPIERLQATGVLVTFSLFVLVAIWGSFLA